MSDSVTLHNPLISREQHDDANLVKWCRWVTTVIVMFSSLLDIYVVFFLGNWIAIPDQAAFEKHYYYSNLLLVVVLIIQIPLILFCVPLIILTIRRGPAVAKKWAVNVLRGGKCYIPSASSI